MANGQHKRPPAPVIVLVVVVVAAAAWWWYSTRGGGAGATDTLSGTVETTEYQVASAMAGRITSVTAGEGDTVKAGELLVKLDDAALKLQVAQAEQGVDAAEALLRQAKDDGTDAEIDVARARLDQAKAAVKIAKVQLGYASVKAAHSGVLVAVPANAGENASPGRALATIADPADLFVRIYVPEPRLGEVSIGQKATVIAGDERVEGTVFFIATQAEFTPNTVETQENRTNLVYEARVRIAPGSTLLAGRPVDVTLEPVGR